MTSFVTVWRVDFDALENRTPRVHSLVIVFAGDGLAAAADAACWIADQKETATLTKGYDGESYPKWYVRSGLVASELKDRLRFWE